MIRRSPGLWLLAPLIGTSVAWGDPPVDAPKIPTPTDKTSASEPDPRRILERADEATKKVKIVKYSLRTQRVDVPDERASKMSGSVIMSGWRRGRPAKFRYEVETRPGGRQETATVIVGYDGEQFWALNMRDKKAFTGDKVTSIGAYQLLVQFFPVTEFVVSEPFGDELHGRKQEFLGTADVDGEPCYKVHTVYSNPGQEATWYFSKKDYLPRRVDRLIHDPAGATLVRSSVISDLVVDPDLAEDVFSLTIPSEFIVADGAIP